jgi:hypothetical protein
VAAVDGLLVTCWFSYMVRNAITFVAAVVAAT